MTELDGDRYLEHLEQAAVKAGLGIDTPCLPEDRHVVVGGLRLHYLDWGNPSLSPVLFLHGGGLTAHTWDLTCLALRSDYHCIALDMRGHGDSEWSPEMDYSLATYAGDTLGLIDLLGVDRIDLVGMSLGGMTSMALAGRRPERLRRLVVVDIGPNLRMDAARRIRRFMTEGDVLDSIDEFVERALAFNPRRDPRLLRDSLLHNLRRLPDGRWTWKYDRRHRVEEGYLEGLGSELAGLRSALPAVVCPVLVVRGAESDVFLAEDAAELAAAFPHGRMVEIPDSGHTVQGDNPAALVAALRTFLGEAV